MDLELQMGVSNHVVWELNSAPLEEYQLFLTAEPAVHPYLVLLLKNTHSKEMNQFMKRHWCVRAHCTNLPVALFNTTCPSTD